MPLSESLNSHTVLSIKLMQIYTVPTTEDLYYMLATATQNKKPVELPFKNPNNNLCFNVRVTPATLQIAPRWAFERSLGDKNTILWTRETNEVMMVQGKIKIECNYGTEPIVQRNCLDMPETDGQPIIMGSPSISISNLAAMSAGQDQTSTSGSSQPSSSTTWLFDQNSAGPVAMPPPVALDKSVLQNYHNALTQTETGLLRPSALEFFLWRDLQYVERHGLKMSLLAFDFVDQATGTTIVLPNEAKKRLVEACSPLTSPLELFSQLKTGEYVILLCGYDGARALEFAQRLEQCLAETTPDALLNLEPLAIGVACIPETCKTPGMLIATAIKAKDLARDSKQPFALFPLF